MLWWPGAKPWAKEGGQGQIHAASHLMGEWCVMVGDEGAYAYHLGLKLLEKGQILGKRLSGLAGASYHHPRSYLVSQLL